MKGVLRYLNPKKLNNLGRTALGILFPPVCPLCEKVLLPADHGKCCGACSKKIRPAEGAMCYKCGKLLQSAEKELCDNCRKRNFHFKRNFTVYPYEAEIRQLITGLKYEGKKYIGEFFARETIKTYGEKLESLGFDAVIPIPIHKSRMKKRGYNQAEVYAGVLAEELNIPMYPYILYRSRHTKAQKNLDTAERMSNLMDAFAVDRSELERAERKGKLKRVLLADDICTTGSTLECASLRLLESGIEEVYCICISGTREI